MQMNEMNNNLVSGSIMLQIAGWFFVSDREESLTFAATIFDVRTSFPFALSWKVSPVATAMVAFCSSLRANFMVCWSWKVWWIFYGESDSVV
jgi:hypothetical protein